MLLHVPTLHGDVVLIRNYERGHALGASTQGRPGCLAFGSRVNNHRACVYDGC